MKILNSFSLNMLGNLDTIIRVKEISFTEAQGFVLQGVESFVGHESTAKMLSTGFGVEIPFNRGTVSLAPGETVLVAQYNGPRLPEGAIRLPEGASIKFLLVTVG